MTTTLAQRSADTAPAPQANSSTRERYNLYTSIHKALRDFMSDTLSRVGRLDVQDSEEVTDTLAQLDALLTLCAKHIQHENDFLHTAIEARRPAGSVRTAGEHAEHFESIESLRCESAQLAAAQTNDDRSTLALRLYRHLALFVADNFQHMHIEETVNAATLWAHYSDAELHAIHGRLLATLAPQDQLQVARWMVPALNPAERAGMIAGMKPSMPPEALLGVLAHVRPHVDAIGWAKLTRAIGVAPTLGLMNINMS
jgi:iron-sulfur cluster repair protein YtfE (RIC family)